MLVLPVNELLLSRRNSLEGQRHRWFERAPNLLPLVGLDSLFLLLMSVTILVVGTSSECRLIRGNAIHFTVARSERFVWPLVRLGQLTVDGEGYLVTAVVDESTRDVVFGFTLGRTLALVAATAAGHRSNQV